MIQLKGMLDPPPKHPHITMFYLKHGQKKCLNGDLLTMEIQKKWQVKFYISSRIFQE